MSEMYNKKPTIQTCVCFFLICHYCFLDVYLTYTTNVCLFLHVTHQPDTYRVILINKQIFVRCTSVVPETGAVSGQTSRHLKNYMINGVTHVGHT
jgi:hypothetical protein